MTHPNTKKLRPVWEKHGFQEFKDDGRQGIKFAANANWYPAVAAMRHCNPALQVLRSMASSAIWPIIGPG
jgi:hypothetical protein